MKNQIFYMLICCLFSISLTAQQNNTFRGKVLYLNSDGKSAVGVKLSGFIKYIGGANTTYSTNDGSYFLVFPKAGVGNPVHLNVGTTDGSGQPIELVNEEALKYYMIPEDPTQKFEIIVCKKGERDPAAKRYYNILDNNAHQKIANLQREKDSLLSEGEVHGKTINSLNNRIAILKKQHDTLALQKEAYFLASVNKDRATQNVLNFLELLDNGTPLQQAISALSLKDAKKALEKSPSQSDATVKELEIIARVSKIISDYEAAIAAYKAIIEDLEKRNAHQLKIASYSFITAALLSGIGKPEAAAKYLKKAETMQQEVEDAQPTVIGFHQVEVPPAFLEDNGCENLSGDEDRKECILNEIITLLKANINITPYTSEDNPKVRVLFTVNTEGEITDIHVDSNYSSLIEKTRHVIKYHLPKMTPGKHEDKNVYTEVGFMLMFY